MLSWIRAHAPLVILVGLITGCGVPLQDEPARLRPTVRPSDPSTAAGGVYSVRVYLVRDGRLTPVTRTTDDQSTATSLDILADGPTEVEKVYGTSTAILPGRFSVQPDRPTPGVSVMVIDVPAGFTQIAGDLQLLATAQLVWTVTDPRPQAAVRMTFGGETIELPTDRGLTSQPVGRADFMSVAPVGDPRPLP